AQRRLIRLHIAASPFPEVRDQPDAVEADMMKRSANSVALAEHPPVRAWLKPGSAPSRTVVVRQDLEHGTATLFGQAANRPDLSVLPELSLRGTLELELNGISRPVTVCAPARELDPSPCLLPSELTLGSRLSYLDQGGAIRLVEHMPAAELVSLADQPAFT